MQFPAPKSFSATHHPTPPSHFIRRRPDKVVPLLIHATAAPSFHCQIYCSSSVLLPSAIEYRIIALACLAGPAWVAVVGRELSSFLTPYGNSAPGGSQAINFISIYLDISGVEAGFLLFWPFLGRLIYFEIFGPGDSTLQASQLQPRGQAHRISINRLAIKHISSCTKHGCYHERDDESDCYDSYL